MTDRKGDGMLERMARAIRPDAFSADYADDWRQEAWRDQAFEAVRAALMAMRISDADMDDDDYVDMLIAGRAVLPEHDEPLQEDAQACFNAMIDAILAESNTPCPTAAHTVGREPNAH